MPDINIGLVRGHGGQFPVRGRTEQLCIGYRNILMTLLSRAFRATSQEHVRWVSIPFQYIAGIQKPYRLLAR